MNTVQTVAIDPAVTVFVGMNKAGKLGGVGRSQAKKIGLLRPVAANIVC